MESKAGGNMEHAGKNLSYPDILGGLSSKRGCSRRHKVLILDNSFDMGGLEKKLFDFIARVNRDHFDIAVCCLKEGGYFMKAFEEMNIRFYHNLLRHKYDLFAYRKLSGIISREKVDLLYSFLHPNTVIFCFIAKAARRVDSWVISVHATGSPTGGRLVRPYLKPFLRQADRFIAVARSHKKYLAEEEGLPASRIDVIHNGVDIDKYCPGGADHSLKRSLGLEGDAAIVTTIASLKPAKCIDVLLKAASQVVSRFENANFMVIGDGPERTNLEAMTANLGLEGRVIFTGIRDDVYDLLRLSSLFVLPSREGTETFPNVLLEAMATGIPVVATDVGSVRELVEDGASAFVVPPEDPGALAEAIARMLSNPGRMKEFGRRGRIIVEKKFTIDRMRAGREDLFARLLCSGHPVSPGAEPA